MTGPWEEYQQTLPMAKAQIVPTPAAQPEGGPWEDYQSPQAHVPSLAEASKEMLNHEVEAKRLSRQGVSPMVFSRFSPAKPQKLGDIDEGNEIPNAYKDTSGTLRVYNPKTDFIATDPETGKLAAFARFTAANGADAENITNEGKLTRIGRELAPGILGPVAGIQRGAQGVAQAARAIDAVGTKTGAALATERAAQAVQDAQAFQNLDVRRFGPAFNQGPVASVAKQLTETPIIGGPLRNALEESWKDTATAAQRIAESMSANASAEQTGAALQRGLDRYRTAGVSSLEPAAIERLGVEAMAPVQPRATMSAGAAERAAQAAQIRSSAGEEATAVSSRGVPVAAARPMEQTILARRGAEDMSPAELSRIIRAPSSDTSFAARQEALFEHAWQQIPAKFKINGAANADLMKAVNTNNAFKQMATAEAKAGISGGIVGGRFAGMADRVKDNVTLPTLKAMRTEIGRALSNFGVYDARLDRTQLKQLYGALSRDIEIGVADLANRARIQSRLGNNRADAVSLDAARRAEGALYALRRADRYTRMGIERMDRFAKIIGTENPQQAAGILIRSALDGTKGNMGMLRTAMAALRPEERSEVSSLVLRELGRPAPSAGGIVQETGFSMESALTRWQAMNPHARELLFGGEYKNAVDDLMRVVSRLANVEKTANRSRSGTNAMNLTALVGSAGSIAAGNVAVPLGVAGTGMVASTLMSRPAYVRWMTGYAKLRAAALRAPVSVSVPRMAAQINRLGELAKRDQALVPVYRAIASENGVVEGGDQKQPIEQQLRPQ